MPFQTADKVCGSLAHDAESGLVSYVWLIKSSSSARRHYICTVSPHFRRPYTVIQNLIMVFSMLQYYCAEHSTRFRTQMGSSVYQYCAQYKDRLFHKYTSLHHRDTTLWEHLIFMNGMAILVRRHRYIDSPPVMIKLWSRIYKEPGSRVLITTCVRDEGVYPEMSNVIPSFCCLWSPRELPVYCVISGNLTIKDVPLYLWHWTFCVWVGYYGQ